MKNFYDAVKDRRTIYNLNDKPVISDEKILEIVKESVKHSPSSFNSQSSGTLILLGDKHKKLWNITKDALKKIVPESNFSDTEARLKGFENGYGTVLFFEDQNVIKNLQSTYPSYKDNFPLWSLQSSGMLQFVVWTALEAEGFGASLQHYNPIIDNDVAKEWNIPESWTLYSQLVFGNPVEKAGEKTFDRLDERVKIYK